MDTETEAPDRSMDGKICLVTGATSGIGEVTARALARRGATVVLVGRDRERCGNTVESIRLETGHDRVGAILADLSRLEEVRLVAEQFRDRFDRLDVLINNAGAMFLDRQVTPDGFERTFALNHLAPFSLTGRLIDLLQRSAPSRVVTVSSEAHRSVKRIDFDNLQGERKFNGLAAYSLSKLMNLLFTFELARRLKGSGVTANALHPGFVRSRFFGGQGPIWWAMRRFADVMGLGPEQGARTSVYLASSPEVEGVSGRYFIRKKEATPSSLSRDEEIARRLWDLSESLTGVRPFSSPEAGPSRPNHGTMR